MLIRNRDVSRNEKLPDIPDLVKFAAGENYFNHVVSFDSPAKGNGGIYTQEYWQSVIDGMTNRGIPLAGGKTSGNGHTALENDFFVVGALHDKIQNRVYFKLAIPQEGFSTSNSGLINSLKNGVGGFSIVATPKVGNSPDSFIEEMSIPRLDYVDRGAMDQLNYSDVDKAIELVKNNRIDFNDFSGSLFTAAGKVSLETVHSLLNKAETREYGTKIYNAIADKIKGVKKVMNKEELVNSMKNLVSTGQISAEEIATIGNIKQRTNADEEKAKNLAAIVEILGLPSDAEIDAIKGALDGLINTADSALEGDAEEEAAAIAQTENRENLAYTTALALIKNHIATQRVLNRAKGVQGKRVNIKEYVQSDDFKKNELLQVALKLNASGSFKNDGASVKKDWRSK
ncbi:MAG: hypothetical protein LBJ41_01835 [Treponema sp.]|jgi:hypothetical protein|nr:hypothetical protein [Treponema sp.]